MTSHDTPEPRSPYLPAGNPEILKLGEKIYELAVEDVRVLGGETLRLGKYHRGYDGNFSEVAIVASVVDNAVHSTTNHPDARFALYLSAIKLAEVDEDGESWMSDTSPNAIELEGIEISGYPFEGRLGRLYPTDESTAHWPIYPDAEPTMVYTHMGDFLPVSIDEGERAQAAVALALAFVIKYDVYNLTTEYNRGANWPGKGNSNDDDGAWWLEREADAEPEPDYGAYENETHSSEEDEVLRALHPDAALAER